MRECDAAQGKSRQQSAISIRQRTTPQRNIESLALHLVRLCGICELVVAKIQLTNDSFENQTKNIKTNDMQLIQMSKYLLL